MNNWITFLSALLILAGCSTPHTSPDHFEEWRWYLGDPGRSHYATLDQINRSNVDQLEVAWTYHTGDARSNNRSEMQANPIIVKGVLYTTTPGIKAIALDAATGELIWQHDPFEGLDPNNPPQSRNRGVMYWEDASGNGGRILYTAGPYLYALDARTGDLISSFAEDGKLDLRTGIERDTTNLYIRANTPGAIYKDLVIMGSQVPDGTAASPPGDIRAFNILTGEMEWIFHTIPHPGEYGYDTWPEDAWTYAGGANAWTGIALDVERGIVFAPTGSPAFDFWGGNRHGENLYGNALIALDADTGERIWHFQVVRHDLWDRDLPSPPNLVTVEKDGQMIDAVAIATKSGHVFVFDRETGESLFPLEEFEVPPSDLRGEQAWPTQVLPTRPAPFARQTYSEDDYSDISPGTRDYISQRMEGIKTGGQYIPPTLDGVLILPGFDGGAEWGGSAYDWETGILYINSNEMPWIHQMTDLSEQATLGAQVYAANCASCHGPDLEGDSQGIYPSLTDVTSRLSRREIGNIIDNGQGLMPGFGSLPREDRRALSTFLFGEMEEELSSEEKELPKSPYGYTGFNRFFDEEGYPAIKPPWGTLNALNLNTGEYEWVTTLGEYEELTERGIPPTGTENYGGPVVTSGGLLFIAATNDEKMRAFDKSTGEVLWETELPAGGYATPSTYQVNGKQYVVIGAGGGKMGTKSGDAIVAFSLP